MLCTVADHIWAAPTGQAARDGQNSRQPHQGCGADAPASWPPVCINRPPAGHIPMSNRLPARRRAAIAGRSPHGRCLGGREMAPRIKSRPRPPVAGKYGGPVWDRPPFAHEARARRAPVSRLVQILQAAEDMLTSGRVIKHRKVPEANICPGFLGSGSCLNYFCSAGSGRHPQVCSILHNMKCGLTKRLKHGRGG